MPLCHRSTSQAWFLVPLLPFLYSLLTTAGFVAAQAGNDLSWVTFDRSQFDGNTALDANGNVQLFWKIADDYSTYGIASRSAGYLALGFSETGAMTGADIALGYRDSTGKFVLENRYADGFVTPQLSTDQQRNIQLNQGNQTDGVTAFVFEKKNKADCLQNQVDVATDSWQWFIYAFSNENAFQKHDAGNKGKKYVKLGTTKTISLNEIRDVAGTKEFSIIQPAVTIPTAETTYCYSLHKLPAGKKNFILSERPKSSNSLLHHLVIYSCYSLSEQFKATVGQPPNCDYENFSNPCVGFLTEWAPGMAGRTFEPGFGKPFGSDSYEYVMLETHYNNPSAVNGEKDSSGYTFFYTDQQVDTEIGTLTLGDVQVTGWSLEPGKDIVARTTICTPECTKLWPSDGITAFSVFFHMHQRGRNQRVQIVREGQEINPLSSIRSFEYGYQFSKAFAEVKLLPGDQLITTCEFDTSNDSVPVPGGLASKDEMCFAWVDYYPANKLLACTQTSLEASDFSSNETVAALCLETDTAFENSTFPSDSLTSAFQRLPESGNACVALVTTPSLTTAAVSASTSTSSTPCTSCYLSQAFFTIMIPFALLTVFSQGIL